MSTTPANSDCPRAKPGVESLGMQRLGIVAGWGSFPIEIARRCQRHGIEVFVAALKGHADPRIADFATDVRWFGVAKLGGHLRYFQQAGIRNIALAGKLFKHRILHEGRGWVDHLPDWTCWRIMYSSFITRSRDARDDTLLTAIVDAYHDRGITVLPITQVAPHLLADAGTLTRRKLSRAQRLDIDFGWKIAQQMGGLDIGQCITVKDQMVLGVEAIEGTDALIERTANLCPRGGFTLIKVAKPKQDMRFDVPTIGHQTVEKMSQAGGAAIAIESGRTIIVDREKTLATARKLGIAIHSVEDQLANSAPSQVDPNLQSAICISRAA